MHMEGLIRRRKLPIRVMHVAEVLDEAMSQGSPAGGIGEGADMTARNPA